MHTKKAEKRMKKDDEIRAGGTRKRPELLDVNAINVMLRPYESMNIGNFFLNNEIGILNNPLDSMKNAMVQKGPFILNDHRFGFITRGEGVIQANLVENKMEAGMIAYVAPGSIITPIRYSDDLAISGVALFEGFNMPFPPDKIPPAFNGQTRGFLLAVSDDELHTIRRIFDTLWHVVRQPVYQRAVVASLVGALMHLYNALYQSHSERHAGNRSHDQSIFDRFIQLVNQHCHEHHRIGYYADRICLTEHYLGTIVHQTSGVTAKEWIDRALISRIQAELLHSDKPVAQIAGELHFANPAFFCKFFKRIVGMTPGEYRRRR